MGTQLINLCFHGIGSPQRELEPGEAHYWITSDMFGWVLDAVVDRDDVRLSFDDGNASDFEIGLPALVERGLRATFFALSGRLDQPGSLSSANLRELVAAGMGIGSHGMRHVPWRGLSAAERENEFVDARARLAQAAGQPVTEAALPLGRYDRQVLNELRGLGYTRVYSSDRLAAQGTAWLQPRFSLTDTDTPTSFTASVLTPRPWYATVPARLKSVIKRYR